VWCVSRFGLFAIRAVQCLSHYEWGLGLYDNDIDPPDEATRQEGWSITPTTVKGARGSRCPRRINLNKPTARCNYTHERHESDKKLPSLAILFLDIALKSTHFGQEHLDMGRLVHSYHGAQGQLRLGWRPHKKFPPAPLFLSLFFFKRKKAQ
jgi:hypothetical protein